MSIWGKILGALFGFMFLKIPGAILGLLVGHFFDKAYRQDFNQLGGFGRFFTDQDNLKQQAILGKRIKWLILPLHESETDRHLIGLSG